MILSSITKCPKDPLNLPDLANNLLVFVKLNLVAHAAHLRQAGGGGGISRVYQPIYTRSQTEDNLRVSAVTYHTLLALPSETSFSAKPLLRRTTLDLDLNPNTKELRRVVLAESTRHAILETDYWVNERSVVCE